MVYVRHPAYVSTCESQKVPKLHKKTPSMTPSQRLPRLMSPLAMSPSHACKYLDSLISYSLRDDNDIDARLIAASQSMGALKEVWRNQHLDTYSKYLLFRVIPMNLLLWGCENWSLWQDLLRHLKVFLHRSARRILHISIIDVQDQHI